MRHLTRAERLELEAHFSQSRAILARGRSLQTCVWAVSSEPDAARCGALGVPGQADRKGARDDAAAARVRPACGVRKCRRVCVVCCLPRARARRARVCRSTGRLLRGRSARPPVCSRPPYTHTPPTRRICRRPPRPRPPPCRRRALRRRRRRGRLPCSSPRRPRSPLRRRRRAALSSPRQLRLRRPRTRRRSRRRFRRMPMYRRRCHPARRIRRGGCTGLARADA